MTAAEMETRSTNESLFLTCPRCRLSIRPRRAWLAMQHCPRCLARSRLPVMLFTSTLPADDLYAAGRLFPAGRESEGSGQ